jgi:hypothetical protein
LIEPGQAVLGRLLIGYRPRQRVTLRAEDTAFAARWS